MIHLQLSLLCTEGIIRAALYDVWSCNAGPRIAQVLQPLEGNLSCAPQIRDEAEKYVHVEVTQEANSNTKLDLLRTGHSGLTTKPLLGNSFASVPSLTCPSTEASTREGTDKLLQPPLLKEELYADCK